MTVRALRENGFRTFLYFSVAVGLLALGALLVQVLTDGLSYVDSVLLFNPPSANPDKAGARPAILATIWLLGLVFLMAVPGGIATAIWLEEFAKKDRWYNRLLELNIQNLAGVPSIVYGIQRNIPPWRKAGLSARRISSANAGLSIRSTAPKLASNAALTSFSSENHFSSVFCVGG